MSAPQQPARQTRERRDYGNDSFQLLIDCPDEQTQKRLYERLVREGFSCRVLVM